MTQWIRPTDISQYYFHWVWSEDLLATYYAQGHGFHLDGSQGFFSVRFPASTQALATPLLSPVFFADRWYFVANTFDVATGLARLYVWDDAASAVTVNAVANWSTYGNPVMGHGDFYVGGHPNVNGVSDMRFGGRIDEMTVWDRALTLQEITDIKDQNYGDQDTVTQINAQGALYALSSLSARGNHNWPAAGTINALATLLARIQVKTGYVPSSILEEPYPVPTLWHYLMGNAKPSTPFEQAVFDFCKDMSQWSKEHVKRILREISRLGQEKQSDWRDVT